MREKFRIQSSLFQSLQNLKSIHVLPQSIPFLVFFRLEEISLFGMKVTWVMKPIKIKVGEIDFKMWLVTNS